MENSKATNPTKETDERVKNDTWTPSCPFWFFGNEDSAKKDLDEKFEVIDDEEKD